MAPVNTEINTNGHILHVVERWSAASSKDIYKLLTCNREMLTGCSTIKEIMNLVEIVIFKMTHTAIMMWHFINIRPLIYVY